MTSSDKKLLLAGGGYADVPLIRGAQALGYSVISSGNRPDEAGHRVSDLYRPGDFSDPEAMLAIARDEGVEAICANCNDFSAVSCAYVAEQLGLPGHDPLAVSQLIHHKDEFRAYAERNDLHCPRATRFTRADDARDYVKSLTEPVMIKAVDLTGGKGVRRVLPDQASTAIDEAFALSKAKRIVIEDYIDGSNHGFTCLLRNGEVAFHFFDNEQYYLNDYLVSGACAPGDVPDSVIRELVQLAETMAADLRLVDGIFHVQFILKAGRPWVIEICRRAPGDLYVELVRHATGVDYARWIVAAAAGLALDSLEAAPMRGYFGRHCIMADRAGEVAGVDVAPDIQRRIIDSVEWWQPGDRVDRHLVEKLGILFLEFDDAPEMNRLMNSMQERVKVRFAS